MDALGIILSAGLLNSSNIRLAIFSVPSKGIKANANTIGTTAIDIPEISSGNPYGIFINESITDSTDAFTNFNSLQISGNASSISSSPNIVFYTFPRSSSLSKRIYNQSSGQKYQFYAIFSSSGLQMQLYNNSSENMNRSYSTFSFMAILTE